MRRYKYKHRSWYLIILSLFLMAGIGYAVINANLSISGTSNFANMDWDVHFENPVATANSTVNPSVAPSAPAISKLHEITYTITLDAPGDIYEFTIDIANRGTIDAMVDSITSTMKIGSANPVNITADNIPSYLDYYVKYNAGGSVAKKQKLVHGTTEKLIIHVEYKKDISYAQFTEANGKAIRFNYGLEYTQADGTEIIAAHPVSFSTDSWETIIATIQSNDMSAYPVGSTKTIELGNNLGTHTIRVANNSTPSECKARTYSQTACGFVIEFADIITTHYMNYSMSNAGGWEDSELRAYISDTIYNALPNTLKNAILSTRVISGHGSTEGETNFTTYDHLYLLSSVEVWGATYYDSVDTTMTRQLDYYSERHVTKNANYSEAIKKFENTNTIWWLRSAGAGTASVFLDVKETGETLNNYPHYTRGVSPAFRIGLEE